MHSTRHAVHGSSRDRADREPAATYRWNPVNQANRSEAGENGPRVLLVEDNEDNRIIYSTILRHYGYDVAEAATGPDALEQARQLHPDIILMDISLPGMDGWTVTRHLKDDPATRGIVIVAITAHALPEDHQKAQELGCASFLPKPVRPRRVLEEVQRLVGDHRDGAGPTV